MKKTLICECGSDTKIVTQGNQGDHYRIQLVCKSKDCPLKRLYTVTGKSKADVARQIYRAWCLEASLLT
jgi:hypothetical protein